jgi:hypothetical protein
MREPKDTSIYFSLKNITPQVMIQANIDDPKLKETRLAFEKLEYLISRYSQDKLSAMQLVGAVFTYR